MDSDGNYHFLVKCGKTSLFAELVDLKRLSFNLSIDDFNIFIKDTLNFANWDNGLNSIMISNQNADFSIYDGEIPYLMNFSVDDSFANIKNPMFNASISFKNSILLLKTSFIEFNIDFNNFVSSIVIVSDDSISTVEVLFLLNVNNLLKFTFV